MVNLALLSALIVSTRERFRLSLFSFQSAGLYPWDTGFLSSRRYHLLSVHDIMHQHKYTMHDIMQSSFYLLSIAVFFCLFYCDRIALWEIMADIRPLKSGQMKNT